MDSTRDFQTIILKLQQFWHDQGCLIWQPYYTQVGAGTNNPATVLRVLGPSRECGLCGTFRSPDDARYGENPPPSTALPFQVILKPIRATRRNCTCVR